MEVNSPLDFSSVDDPITVSGRIWGKGTETGRFSVKEPEDPEKQVLDAINKDFEFLDARDMPISLQNSVHRTHRVRALRENRWLCEDCGQFLKVVSLNIKRQRKLLRY